VATSAVPATVGTTYSAARGTITIDGRARVLRLQLVPLTPGRLRADNLYLIPQSGCAEPRYPVC
jgi:hypothetical protein